MTLHVVALPHTQTTDVFLVCAYTAKVINFCRMMMDRGQKVILYAGERNTAPCTEHVVCAREDERAEHVGAAHYTSASFDTESLLWQNFNTRCVREIRDRAAPHDVLCLIAGVAHQPIAEALPDMLCVEFGVGYGGFFSKFKVFESYAWMHTCYGARSGGDPHSIDGQWFDTVIPGYLDPALFPLVETKDDYFLYIGRLIDRKGLHIAAEVCKNLGKRLVVAGPGTPPQDCEYVGIVGPAERAKLMGNATAVFVPTIYIEPFGNVAVEAQACGTPVIATDWGAMTETVIPDVTGYRCRTFGEFCRAAELCHILTPRAIRDHAVKRYDLAVIGKRYESYFNRLANLWGPGWYDDHGLSLQRG